MGVFKAVFFDLDGTLWNSQDCSNYILRVVMPQIMERVEEPDANRVVDTFNSVFLDMVKEYGLYDQRVHSRVERFERLLKHYDIDDAPLAQELGNKYAAARKLYMRNFLKPESAEVLEELQDRHLTLGVITNGVPIIQRQTLESLGLAEYFDHVVISGLVGYQKPDRRIFDHAAERAGCSAEETLYIGDNPTVDVAGAARAGWRSVLLFSPWRALSREMPMPDFVITRLTQLLRIVDGAEPDDPEVALLSERSAQASK